MKQTQREVWIINVVSSLRTITYEKGIQAGVVTCDENGRIINVLYCFIFATFKKKTQY